MYVKFSTTWEAVAKRSYNDVERNSKWLGPTSVNRDREGFILVRTRVRSLFWRDVRDLAIEEALTNRWLSMKKDITSCGRKYLAYSKEEVEYQGSSGLLLQPELPE
ncbi:hypothetical protein Tco_0657398 [Tanacetum coccineum]|uniref:Uncharacterized protein n=1 Tax=Tanacetum coccineum TaxID=301880 RepID=A0ABQ4XBG2_9ASTR